MNTTDLIAHVAAENTVFKDLPIRESPILDFREFVHRA
jgi:hypothetical protein